MIALEEISIAITPHRLALLGLSKRETEVLAWVAQGKTNDEIGHILRCSHRTVQKHLERIYVKLGVENRTTAAVIATETARMSLSPR
jgi:DNA-binding CsgD family transcriptional regulator